MSGPWREIKRRVDSFAAPEGGGVGGSGVGVVEYVRLVLGRRRRQTNGCLGFAAAIFGGRDLVVLGTRVGDGECVGALGLKMSLADIIRLFLAEAFDESIISHGNCSRLFTQHRATFVFLPTEKLVTKEVV